MCTLVLTDLVDSTGLVQALGEARAAEMFRRVDRVARDLLTERDGLEIDRTDGHLVLFDLPLAGVEYAVTFHERLAELGSEIGVPLSCRAAVHVGEVIVRANAPEDVARGAKPVEVEGITKPATARLLSLALPGQTLLGRTAYELARRATVGQPTFDRYVWATTFSRVSRSPSPSTRSGSRDTPRFAHRPTPKRHADPPRPATTKAVAGLRAAHQIGCAIRGSSLDGGQISGRV
jgi:class 3 adenylate cyclase